MNEKKNEDERQRIGKDKTKGKNELHGTKRSMHGDFGRFVQRTVKKYTAKSEHTLTNTNQPPTIYTFYKRRQFMSLLDFRVSDIQHTD